MQINILFLYKMILIYKLQFYLQVWGFRQRYPSLKLLSELEIQHGKKKKKQLYKQIHVWKSLVERRPQNIYSQEEINLYCIIKLAT